MKGHKVKKKDRASLMVLLAGSLVILILMGTNVLVRGRNLEIAQLKAISYLPKLSGIPLPLKGNGNPPFGSQRVADVDVDQRVQSTKMTQQFNQFSIRNHAWYRRTANLVTSILSSANNSLKSANSSLKSNISDSSFGKVIHIGCEAFGGIDRCPDWIRLDSPCSPAHPCKDLSLEHHYVHPACQPSWVGRHRDGTRFYTTARPSDTSSSYRRRRSRRRGPSVDWYADGLRPSTTRSYPGHYAGGRLRWSPQPRPPYVHGYYPGTCEPDNYQAKHAMRLSPYTVQADDSV